jgi:LuxR family maltose regulon positive regulatory protein
MNGEAELALEFVQRAMENLPEEDWAARTHLLNIKGLALQYRGDFLEATRAFEMALAAGKKIGRVHELLYTSSNLAYAHLLQGHLREAFSLCQIAVYKTEEVHQSSQRFPVLAHAYATKCNILIEWNELESAVSLARQAVALAEQWGQADALNYAMSCLSEALGAAGEFEEAFAVNLQAMKLTGTISPWYARISAENEIMLLLAKGEVPAAAKKYECYFSAAEENKNNKVLFMEVSLLYQQNHFPDVIKRVDKTLDELQQKGWNLLWIKLLPIYALSLQAVGRDAEAQQALEMCLAAAETEGFVRMFVERGAPMASLLKTVRNKGVRVEYTTKLLAAFHLPEDAPKPEGTGAVPIRSAGANLIEPLSERELEVLRYLNSHLSVPEIAGEMMIAPTTLRTHIRNIYNKLNVHGRLEALQKARDLGLF